MADAALFLIKHSVPAIRPEAPPASWRLSDKGRAKASRVADYLGTKTVDRVVSSTEPKAIETAEIVAKRLGLEVEVGEGLHEHVLEDWFATEEAFQEAVTRFFARPGERLLGGESAYEAASRYERAIHEITSEARGSVAVVSHGRVMSLFAAPRFGEEVVTFWRRLGLPSLVALELPGLEPQALVERF